LFRQKVRLPLVSSVGFQRYLELKVTPTQCAELCERIAELIEQRGHAVGTMKDHHGRYCLLGAGRAAQTDSDVNMTGFVNQDYITAYALGFPHPGDVVTLNDGRTDSVDGRVTDRRDHLNKDKAIELAMNRAKEWREKG